VRLWPTSTFHNVQTSARTFQLMQVRCCRWLVACWPNAGRRTPAASFTCAESGACRPPARSWLAHGSACGNCVQEPTRVVCIQPVPSIGSPFSPTEVVFHIAPGVIVLHDKRTEHVLDCHLTDSKVSVLFCFSRTPAPTDNPIVQRRAAAAAAAMHQKLQHLLLPGVVVSSAWVPPCTSDCAGLGEHDSVACGPCKRRMVRGSRKQRASAHFAWCLSRNDARPPALQSEPYTCELGVSSDQSNREHALDLELCRYHLISDPGPVSAANELASLVGPDTDPGGRPRGRVLAYSSRKLSATIYCI
jgi:hypothetical protein